MLIVFKTERLPCSCGLQERYGPAAQVANSKELRWGEEDQKRRQKALGREDTRREISGSRGTEVSRRGGVGRSRPKERAARVLGSLSPTFSFSLWRRA